MLVLTRKAKQSIIIGDGIEVTVVEIKGDAVRIAIEAPRHIPVHRKEVYEEIQRENRAASSVSLADVSEIDRLLGSTPRPERVSDARDPETGSQPGSQPTTQAPRRS